jgi:hypothetical protein
MLAAAAPVRLPAPGARDAVSCALAEPSSRAAVLPTMYNPIKTPPVPSLRPTMMVSADERRVLAMVRDQDWSEDEDEEEVEDGA